MRAHFLIATQLWNDEATRWTFPSGDYPFGEVSFDYTNAIAAIHRGDLAAAREAIARVEKDGTRCIALMKKMGATDGHEGLDIYNGELHAMLAAAEGKTTEAVAELRQMAEKEHHLPVEFGPPSIEKPTDEMLGELLLQLHRPAEAREAFVTALSRTPGRTILVEALARTDKEIAAMPAAKTTASAPAQNH
jgi:hypothetical protein